MTARQQRWLNRPGVTLSRGVAIALSVMTFAVIIDSLFISGIGYGILIWTFFASIADVLDERSERKDTDQRQGEKT